MEYKFIRKREKCSLWRWTLLLLYIFRLCLVILARLELRNSCKDTFTHKFETETVQTRRYSLFIINMRTYKHAYRSMRIHSWIVFHHLHGVSMREKEKKRMKRNREKWQRSPTEYVISIASQCFSALLWVKKYIQTYMYDDNYFLLNMIQMSVMMFLEYGLIRNAAKW